MTLKTTIRALGFAGAMAIGTAAMALNPQPEPPMAFLGMEYVIAEVAPGEWSWEVRRPAVSVPSMADRPAEVLATGSVKGTRLKAVVTARGAIRRLTVSAGR